MLLTISAFLLLFLKKSRLGNAAEVPFESAAHIREYLRVGSNVKSAAAQSQPLCGQYPCCNVTQTESCPLSSFPLDKTAVVLPGGGGGCWDRVSTNAPIPMCATNAVPQGDLVGIYDRKSNLNAFADYTIVQPLYCSGDVWGGNTTRRYNDSAGNPVVQVGLINAQTTLSWVVAQQEAGLLSPNLDSLVVMGASAGSVGAQLWSHQVLSALKWKHAAVVPDSYAGAFPEGSIGPILREWGFCSWSGLSKELRNACWKGVLNIPDVTSDGMKKNPNVPFAFMQSKTDNVQISFYVAIGVTTRNSSAKITPAEYYSDVSEIFSTYSSQHPNFIAYLVDGYDHCFTYKPLYYNATCLSHGGHIPGNTCELLYNWTNLLPLQAAGQQISSQCQGPTDSAEDKVRFCSPSVIPKTFTAP